MNGLRGGSGPTRGSQTACDTAWLGSHEQDTAPSSPLIGLAVIERGIAPAAIPGALAFAAREVADLADVDALTLGLPLDGVDVAIIVRRASRREIGAIVIALCARGWLGNVGVHRIEPIDHPGARSRRRKAVRPATDVVRTAAIAGCHRRLSKVSGTAEVDRDTRIARVVVNLLALAGDAGLASAYHDLRGLPSAVRDAVLIEARRRADLDRAEAKTLHTSGRGLA